MGHIMRRKGMLTTVLECTVQGEKRRESKGWRLRKKDKAEITADDSGVLDDSSI